MRDRAHGVQRGHAGRGRHDPDPGSESLRAPLRAVGVQLGIDRFGGQEHQRAVGGFALEDVRSEIALICARTAGRMQARGSIRLLVIGARSAS